MNVRYGSNRTLPSYPFLTAFSQCMLSPFGRFPEFPNLQKKRAMKILVVENEPRLMDMILGALDRDETITEMAFDFDSALTRIEKETFDCIVLDLELPGGSGIDLLEELHRMNRRDNVLLVSGPEPYDERVAAITLGADDFLTRPFGITELVERVKQICGREDF